MNTRKTKGHGIGRVIEMFVRAGLTPEGGETTLAGAAWTGMANVAARYRAVDGRSGAASHRTMGALAAAAAEALGASSGPARVRAARVTRAAQRQARRGRFFLSTRWRPEGVVYVELEEPGRESPDVLLVWEADDASKGRCRTSGVWMHGRWGSTESPLVLSVAREAWHSDDMDGEVLRIGEPGKGDVPKAPEAEAMCDAMVDHCEPVVGALLVHERARPFEPARARQEGAITVPAGAAQRTAARARAARAGHTPVVSAFAGLEPPGGTPPTALDALVASARWSAAVEGHNLDTNGIDLERMGDPDTMVGAIVWHQKLALHARSEAEEGGKPALPCAAIEMTYAALESALRTVSGAETGRAAMQAILAPRALRQALEQAGPSEAAQASARNETAAHPWYVENEAPRPGEPRALVLMDAVVEGDTRWAVGMWTHSGWARPQAPFVAALGERAEGGRFIGGARLGIDPERMDIEGPERAALEAHGDAMLEAIDVALGAIAHHVSSAGRNALERAPERPGAFGRAGTGGDRGNGLGAGRPGTGLFAIVRAAPPARAPQGAAGGGRLGGSREAGPVRERHWVSAHWKRQRFGPEGKLRKTILIDAYERGPEPGPDQMAMTRLHAPRPRRREREERR